MITLGIIVYVIISIRIYYAYKKDNTNEYTGEWKRGESKKIGMLFGFSFIPVLIVVCLLIVGGLYILVKIAMGILWVIGWIAVNMP
ncbi:hypothetical protein BCB4_0224 [Bacillus phage B4]|uniref:Uncharacterized protein n=2 Tax=Bequatrovirus B4 TaxID=1918005 RepID=J9PQW1_9CAUD|nr:hypothetical protein BCB4_0224 [Bacillus phage B4]YP_009783814.1 hypothetical protein QLX26_gp218 [Bacillus phage B5S]MEB9013806.1 hypothetical protein [Bacillus cereus]AEW47452.1 hypothetical protein B5S_0218 [Bacillus phage B5S]AEZ66017.1 hypothetical protein BCB4_0224 [Bacillus phage B4]MEB9190579.1 hypothetical protein [Bacillus cereus]